LGCAIALKKKKKKERNIMSIIPNNFSIGPKKNIKKIKIFCALSLFPSVVEKLNKKP